MLQDTLGRDVQPSVTLELAATYGVLTIQKRKGVVFIHGKGHEDRNLIIRGALDRVNNVLQTLYYACKVQYGCIGDSTDIITIKVDDEGYVGKGGALTATSSITVAVTAHQ
jgi:hypothetical protein